MGAFVYREVDVIGGLDAMKTPSRVEGRPNLGITLHADNRFVNLLVFINAIKAACTVNLSSRAVEDKLFDNGPEFAVSHQILVSEP